MIPGRGRELVQFRFLDGAASVEAPSIDNSQNFITFRTPDIGFRIPDPTKLFLGVRKSDLRLAIEFQK